MIKQMMHLDFMGWIYGLLSAIIGGGAGAVTAAVAAAIIKPQDFAFADASSLKLMFWVFIVNGTLNMFYYLKQSPLPPVVENGDKK